MCALASQSMVVLQLLVWLCRPMREWQSLRHMGQMKLKEGKAELFFAESALFFSFLVTLHICFLVSLSVSSEHDESQHQYNTIQYNVLYFERVDT